MGVIIKNNFYKGYRKNASNVSFRQEGEGREPDSATTPAQDVLTELSRAGFLVARIGDSISIGPKDRMTPAVLARVKCHKPALLRYLEMEAEIIGPTADGTGGRLQGAFSWLFREKEQKGELDDEYHRFLPAALSMLDVYEKACEMGRAT